MTVLRLRNTTPEDLRSLTVPNFRRYDILRKDEQNQKIGEVSWAYRPKNAGGSAWQAKLDGDTAPVVVYSKTIKQLCEIIRYVVTREGEPPKHWR